MKNFKLKIAFLLSVGSLSIGAYAQNVSIPDPIFEQYLISQGYDDVLNGVVNKNNLVNVFGIDVSNKGINNLSGIQYFPNLQWIDFRNNNLTSINLASNSKLKKVLGPNNNLTSIALPNNNKIENLFLDNNNLSFISITGQSNLEVLLLNNNNFSNINVQHNLKLRQLSLENNNFVTLNVANNVLLETLVCNNNNLSYLNISTLSKLKMLSAQDNQLLNLDVSNNPLLEQVLVGINKLESLDLSTNPNVKWLLCHQNKLESLNVKNGNNTAFTLFNTLNNDNLTCILVDNESYNPSFWTYGSQTLLSDTSCEPQFAPPVVYPNPFYDWINVGPENNGINSYRLYWDNGQIYSQGTLENNQINGLNLPPGNYILHLLRNNEVVKSSIVVKAGRYAGGTVPKTKG